jgi:hypothetical protein
VFTATLVTVGSSKVGIVELPLIIATVPAGEIKIALALSSVAVAAVQVPLQK